MLKDTTKAILKRAKNHHLGRGTSKANLGRTVKKSYRFNAGTKKARKRQADHLKAQRKAGRGDFHKKLYIGPK